MDILDITKNIELRDNGIFFSQNTSDISYPETGNDHCMQIEEESFWFKHRNNIIAESVKHGNPKKTFFDIGGGNGFVAKRLQEEGIDVVLVEPGITGALNAKRRKVKSVICATLESASFKEWSLDSVGLFDVVEHIENDEDFLKDIYRYLKPEGLVYLTVPAFNALWFAEDDDAGHYRRYTLKRIKLLLEKSGFEISYATYIFSFLPIPVLLFRSIPSVLGFNKNSQNLEKHKEEHKVKNGLISSMLNKIWSWELNQIKKKRSIPFGGSCYVVAKKSA